MDTGIGIDGIRLLGRKIEDIFNNREDRDSL